MKDLRKLDGFCPRCHQKTVYALDDVAACWSCDVEFQFGLKVEVLTYEEAKKEYGLDG